MSFLKIILVIKTLDSGQYGGFYCKNYVYVYTVLHHTSSSNALPGSKYCVIVPGGVLL